MKIVIVGGGKVGFAIAREVSAEGHDVTIIDSSRAVCDRLSLALDGMTVQGNGAALDVQHAALVPDSDLLIAVSPNDEANILACMLARKIGCANTIARIRSRNYLNGVQLLREELGLSMAVTPDLYAAREIFRQLQLPAFLRRESFAKSRAEIVAMEVDADNKLCGKKLMELPRVLAPPRARVRRPPRGGGVHPGRLVCDPGRGRGISDRTGGDPFAHRGRAGAAEKTREECDDRRRWTAGRSARGAAARSRACA